MTLYQVWGNYFWAFLSFAALIDVSRSRTRYMKEKIMKQRDTDVAVSYCLQMNIMYLLKGRLRITPVPRQVPIIQYAEVSLNPFRQSLTLKPQS